MMVRTWPQIRYWLALSVSFCTAVLIISSSLAMGGPSGTVGWTAAAVILMTPIAIWWTKGTRMGSLCQHLSLALVALSIVWVAFLSATLS